LWQTSFTGVPDSACRKVKVEQIISQLRKSEVLISQGTTIAIIDKEIGVSWIPYHRLSATEFQSHGGGPTFVEGIPKYALKGTGISGDLHFAYWTRLKSVLIHLRLRG
jgi:hypothetical protein